MSTAVLKAQVGTPRRPRQFVSAFTLVEVLLVVAVLGLLSAILLPALRGARAQTRLVQCAANLREIGVGLNLYADMARDTLPTNGSETWHTAWTGTQGLEIYGHGDDTWISALQATLGRDTAPWLAPLRCPASAACPTQPESITDINERPGASWILNSYCRGRSQTAIPNPAEGVLVLERGSWTYMAEDTGSLESPTRPECYPHPSVAGAPVAERWDWPYHGHKRNILWCDSHVAAFAAAHWPDGDGTFDEARCRHMRFNVPGQHPLDP